MRSWVLAPLMALLAPSIGWSGAAYDPATLSAAAQVRDAAADSALAWKLLESLTTEVGPRMAGSPGDARAVAWARKKFEELGFDRVQTEPVTFPRWRRGVLTLEVIAPFEQPLAATALGGSVGTHGVLEARVVPFPDLAALEAAADDSLEGQVAFITNRMTRARDGSGYGPAVSARSRGASVAARKGASALLIRSIGTGDARLPHTGLMRYAPDAGQIPAAALSNPDADLLEAMLERAEPVVVHLEMDAGMDGEATSYNVLGDMVGSDAPEEIVIIGCHLDSWDLGTGAIDDGAGCAITMAAASLIRRELGPTRRTIRVALFANEEQGLWGGKAYREAHANEITQHVIGSESDFGAGRIYRFSTRVGESARGAIDQMMEVLAPLGIVRGDNAASGGPDLSAMREAGMAVATLHQDGTDYFDYHHTANDTLDKVDPEALAQNTAAWAAFTWLAAQYAGSFGSEPRPAEIPGDEGH